jgi:hypothetical protein
MDQVTSSGKYESFVELYKTVIKLPNKENLGLIMIVQSDFLFNDINFVMTNMQTKKIYHNTRRENLKRVVLD